MFRITGTDLTQIDSIDIMTVMTILSEAGWDMSKWKTEDHFVSWLRLCPDNKVSGDKIIGKARLPTNSIALKMAASTLRTSNTYLGAQFRRLRTKLGAPVAIKAMAAKLARLVYRMLRHGMQFLDQGVEFYEAQHRKLQINSLKCGPELGLEEMWLRSPRSPFVDNFRLCRPTGSYRLCGAARSGSGRVRIRRSGRNSQS